MHETIAVRRNPFSALATRAGAFIDKLTSGASLVASIMLVICSLAIIFEIVSRQVFNSPTKWEFEFTVYLMIWFTFLSQAFSLKMGSQIQVDIVTSRLNKSYREGLEIGALFMGLLYCTTFTYFAFIMVAKSFNSMETTISYTGIILWPIKAAVFVGMLLLSLQVLKMLITRGWQLQNQGFKGIVKSKTIATILIFVVCSVIGLVFAKIWGLYGLLGLLLILLFGGVPVAFSLGLTGAIGLFLRWGGIPALGIVPVVGYTTLDNFVFIALPLFIFAGQIMQRGGISNKLFYAATTFVGHFPGGLAVAAFASCAIFSSMTGSSAACAATIGLIAIPVLLKNGYSMSMSCGIIAAGGALGVLIPPSNSMILIGLITEESVGKLFMAGIIPGIIVSILGIVLIVFLCRKGKQTSLPAFTWKDRFIALKNALWALLMPVIVLGGIYTGIFTVTEAAAVAVCYAFLITIANRELKIKELPNVLNESTKTIGMIFMIIIGALIVGIIMTKSQIGQNLVNSIITSGLPGPVFILFIMLLGLILGMFLEAVSCTLIIVPIVFGVLANYDYNVIWFAVLFTVNMEIGSISPPVGMNNFIIQQIAGTRLEIVLKGVYPFVILYLVCLLIFALFPQLSLWIPSTM